MNVCERRSKIHVPAIEQADDVGMISLQESHTKGIAKPGTALTDANSEGCNLEVLMLKVGFGHHSRPPAIGTVFTDHDPTVPAVRGLAFGREPPIADHTVRLPCQHLGRGICLGKLSGFPFGLKGEARHSTLFPRFWMGAVSWHLRTSNRSHPLAVLHREVD